MFFFLIYILIKQWLLTIGLFCHDLTEVIVLSNYSIQCYLLRCYLNNVKDKLLQHTIEPIEWMKVYIFLYKLFIKKLFIFNNIIYYLYYMFLCSFHHINYIW